MDHRSDPSRLTVRETPGPAGTIVEPPAGGWTREPSINCDQAIFTCIRSPVGQGYRIIAASPGVHRTESAEIAARAPSGDGLYDARSQAVGMAFTPLGTGRYAILHSVYAGKEPTGRGGQRTYTRTLVLGADELRRFRYNAFDVLRTAEAAGALDIDLAPSKVLPHVTLAPATARTTQCLDAAVKQLGDAWLGHLVDKLLSNETLVVAANGDLTALAEALVLVIPAPLRPSISFSAGMRFSIGRLGRLTVVGSNEARCQALLRGRRVAFTDASKTRTPPHPPGHPWALAAQRFLATRRADCLVALGSDRLADADIAELERIGNACLDLDNLTHAEPAELLDAAAAYLNRPIPSPLGAELSGAIVRLARDRLNSLLARADALAMAAVWRDLIASLRQAANIGASAKEFIRSAITRMTQVAPLDAVAMTLEAAASGQFDRTPEELNRIGNAVIASVTGWLATAPAGELDSAHERLVAWCRRFPNDAAGAALLACIEKRRAG